jgi:uncharacterized protein with HEPN domain
MSKRRTEELLEDIKEAAGRIAKYITGMDYQAFLSDLKTQDAVVRNVEIIGEAVKKLPGSFTSMHSGIPWKEMAGTRDKLIHDYFGVNYDILWNIAKSELPGILVKIGKLPKS